MSAGYCLECLHTAACMILEVFEVATKCYEAHQAQMHKGLIYLTI